MPADPIAATYAAKVRLAKIFGFQAYLEFDKLTQADLLAIYTVMDVDNQRLNGK